MSHTHDHDHAATGGECSVALTENTLNVALQTLGEDGRFFFADLQELNNSDAEGAALLVLNGDQLTVVTAAAGVETDQIHPQHIHGFENGRDARIPDLDQDADRDGFIELAEGAATYGPVLLNLTSPPGPEASGFPKPCGTSYLTSETYDLSDPVNGEMAKLLLDAPLTNRHIVVHGVSTLRGHGAGTEGEVDGTAGYKLVLPIAAGEIERMARGDAIEAFQDSLALDLGRTLVGDQGNNTLNSGRGDDVLRARAGDDRLFGNKGADTLLGGDGNDRLVGGEDNDRLIGGTGDDTFVFGLSSGVDRVITFDAGADRGDVLDVRALFDDFGDVMASARTNIAGSTVIDLEGDNTIVLFGVTEAELSQNDFFFG